MDDIIRVVFRDREGATLMRRNQWFSLAVLLMAVPCGLLYAGFAYYSVKAIVFPIRDIGFGPHTMPIGHAMFLVVRAISGVLLAVASFMILVRRAKWIWILFFSLVAINSYNIYSVLDFVPAAKLTNSNVLDFFSPIILMEYVLHFFALIVSVFFLRLSKGNASS